MRIFATSDIHVDYEENARWVEQLSSVDYQEDTLILAGDISDVENRLATTFESFASKFAHVLFVPGNHDIWVKQHEQITSVEKYKRVLKLAQNCGVKTERVILEETTLVPLHSWYDFSFGEPSDFILNAWMDFKRCRWPDSLPNESSILHYFLGKNRLDPVEQGHRVITVSHFLPRIDIMPEFIPPKRREIYPVLGSHKIDEQVRMLQSDIHIYGHSHVNRKVEIDGVIYTNNAFGYPNEERIARKSLMEI